MRWRARADRRVVDAVVATFRDAEEYAPGYLPACAWDRLSALGPRDWARSYYWLDASGMALYLLDHLKQLGIEGALPDPVLARLEQNHADNTLRSAAMFTEFAEINSSFQREGVRYSNLKGFSLSPDSCPDPTLRCQLDLDFLVDSRQLKHCQSILAETGYTLAAATETTWEFKAGRSDLARMEDHYKIKPQRCVELHFAPASHGPNGRSRDALLDRTRMKTWNGVTFPALSDGDLFVGQAMHVFGHLRGACTRLAWLLEYKCNVQQHRDDLRFWDEVLERSARYPQAPVGIGLVSVLTSQIFGMERPAQLDGWTADVLPAPVQLWAECYGRRALLADFPGTKLYMILEDELAKDQRAWRKTKRASLVPLRRAPRILAADANDTLWKRCLREWYQLRFVLFRIRFHLVEGLRYLVEARRWRRHTKELEMRGSYRPNNESYSTKSGTL